MTRSLIHAPRRLRQPWEDNFQALNRLGLTKCDGSRNCAAERHIHGCFSDTGNCDRPDEYHGPLDA